MKAARSDLVPKQPRKQRDKTEQWQKDLRRKTFGTEESLTGAQALQANRDADSLWYPLTPGETTLLRRALSYYVKSFAPTAPREKRVTRDLNELVVEQRENAAREEAANALDAKLLKGGVRR